MSEKLLNRCTVEKIVGKIVAPQVGEVRELCIIAGYARTMEKKASQFGESIGFKGDFRGINVETGEMSRASTCYLPRLAEGLLAEAVSGAEGQSVEFGFKIAVVGVNGRTPEEKGKYEYLVEPLMEASESDPLVELTAKLANGAKLLAAPAKATSKPSAKAKK